MGHEDLNRIWQANRHGKFTVERKPKPSMISAPVVETVEKRQLFPNLIVEE